MKTYQQLFNQLLKNIKVELGDEFDRNFERKAFFNIAWKPAKFNRFSYDAYRWRCVNRCNLKSSTTMPSNGNHRFLMQISTTPMELSL